MSPDFVMTAIRPERPIWGVQLRREQAAARTQLKAIGFRFHGTYCGGSCWLDKAGVPPFVWWTDDAAKAEKLREYADAAAMAALDGVQQADQASRAVDADVDLPCPDGLAYLPYQRAGISWLLGRFADGQTRALLADEMGLGKTIQAIGTINGDAAIKNVLIVVPASLRVNWRRECEKWLTRRSTVVIADNAKDVPTSWTGDLVVILNYEKLITAAASDPTVVAACRKAADRIEEGGKKTIQGKAWQALCETPLPAGLEICGKVRKTLTGSPETIAQVVATLRAYGGGPTLSSTLMDRAWDLLAVDESHRVKNDRAAQTAAVLGSFPKRKDDPRQPGLVDRAARLVLMTGTPVTNRVKDLWTAVRTMVPDTLGRNFFSFAKRYCDATNNGYGWDFGGSSNLDELQRRLRSEGGGCMIRRLKVDVLTELPPKRRQVLAIAPNGASAMVEDLNQRAEAREAEMAALEAEMLMAQTQRDIEAYNRAVLEMERIRGMLFEEMAGERSRLGEAKAPYVAEYVKGLLEDGLEKVVVFAHHRKVVDILMQALSEYAPVSLTGETPMAVRQAHVDAFQTNPAVRVFVGNMQAAGVGITLTAASTVVFAELDWTPANILQSEDRCHRIGQVDSVNVIHMVFDESLDQRMAELIVQKMDDADAALDRRRQANEEGIVLDETEAPWMRPAAPGSDPKPRSEGYVPAQVRRARQEGGVVAPDLTPEQTAAVHQAMQILAGMCDGAQSKDGAGFSKPWVRSGHWIASLDTLDEATARAAYTACCIFRKQLPADLKETIGV